MLQKLLLSYIILSSIFACEKATVQKTYVKITTEDGPEDILHDKKNNRILISCDERRDGKLPIGIIQQLNIATDSCTELPISNMPAIPFHPHGFDLQTIHNSDYLFVINHYKDATHTNSIIQFKIHADKLEFIKEYKHALLLSPNDLTVLPNGSFYFSNDKNSSNILEHLTNPYSGSVVYCDGMHTWKKVDSLMSFPNGLYNENDKLYVATSRNFALYTYTIQADGTLQNKKKLNSINGMDNLTDNGNELLVAVHPDELKFAALAYFPDILSPSKTFAIDKSTGKSTLIFSDDGAQISGSSTAVAVGDNLYLGQVFAGYLLKITHYRD